MSTSEKRSPFTSLDDLTDALDSEDIPTVAPSINTDCNDKPGELTPCYDCGKLHLPRRVVCCVDGTWMSADGATGFEKGNATNIFRIWASIKDGIVEDAHGNQFQQIRRYFKGLGATMDMSIPKLIAGAMGYGFDRLILRVYKFCVMNCCPSTDELWLFGHSRGSYIVRAVAALFQHMGTLKRELDDFDAEYWDAIRIYRGLQEKSDLHKHELYLHRVQNTRDPIKIRMVGVLDTVKMTLDHNFYDLSQTNNIKHVRHAMALSERRALLPLTMYGRKTLSDLGERSDDRSCIESWFLGAHGNIGGGMKEDGLSLWSLQFMLSEAQKQGLVLGFHVDDLVNVSNPIDYCLPANKGPMDVSFQKEAVKVQLWDLTEQFSQAFPIALQDAGTKKERLLPQLGSNGKGYYAMIHPSVYYHDDTSLWGLMSINSLKARQDIRGFRDKLDVPWGHMFWNRAFDAQLASTVQQPRVLICGAHGVGKSRLVNSVLQENASPVSAGTRSQSHDINRECRSGHSNIVFHDSTGFDSGNNSPFQIVQGFIDDRKTKVSFLDQLHCIWYCLPARAGRINRSDESLIQGLNFSGIELNIVFTDCHEVRDSSRRAACSKYLELHPESENFEIEDLDFLPFDMRRAIAELATDIYESEKNQRIAQTLAHFHLDRQTHCYFVGGGRQDNAALNSLIAQTTQSLRSQVLEHIHLTAMQNHRQAVLTEVIPKLAALREKREFFFFSISYLFRNQKKFIDNAESIKAEDIQIYLAKPQKIVAKAFGLTLSSEANFSSLEEMFQCLASGSEDSLPTTDEFSKSIFGKVLITIGIGYLTVATYGLTSALLAFNGTASLSAIVLLANGVRYGIELNRSATLLTLMAHVVIYYDRMYWFKPDFVTQDISARAMIEALKIFWDMYDFIYMKVKAFEFYDWEKVLSEAVDKFKHTPERLRSSVSADDS